MDQELFITLEELEAKREQAKSLLKGREEIRNLELAVSLLEECVEYGDTDAMLMLAACYALGSGVQYDATRAEVLISEASLNENEEAKYLWEFLWVWIHGIDKLDLKRMQLTLSPKA